MGHRVPNHQGKCRNPHGHRYRLEMTVHGDICTEQGSGKEGMVLDFGEIKSLLTTKIHDALDHRFMVSRSDCLLQALPEAMLKDMDFFVVDFIPTAENIIIWCYKQLRNSLPAGAELAALRLYETPNSWADYRPALQAT